MFELLGLLSPVLAPAVIVTLVWPRQLLWQYISLVALIFVGASIWLGQQKMDGAGDFMAIVMLMLVAVVMAIAIAAKLVISAWMAKKHPVGDRPSTALWITWADFLFLLAIFAGVWALALNLFADALRTTGDSAAMHWALGGAAGGAIALAILSRLPASMSLRRFGPPILLAFAVVAGGAVFVSLRSIGNVEAAARFAGGDAPYCIQMADSGGEYISVASRTDLSMLTMRSTRHGFISLQHHALLFRQDPQGLKMLNWSYDTRSFRDDALHRDEPEKWPGVYCKPTSDFVDKLPLPRQASDAPIRVMMQGREYTIPTAYNPRIATGERASIRLSASPPAFTPKAIGTFSDKLFVQYDGGAHPKWLLGDEEAPYGPGPYGLEVRRNKGHQEFRHQSEAGTSAIRCSTGNRSSPISCQHAFSRGAISFSFRHSANHLHDWRGMEDRASALLMSFEGPPRPSAPSPSPAPARR